MCENCGRTGHAKPSATIIHTRRTTRADILRVRAKRLTSIPHSIIASAAMLMASEQVKSELMNLGKVRTCLSMLSLVRTLGFLGARPAYQLLAVGACQFIPAAERAHQTAQGSAVHAA